MHVSVPLKMFKVSELNLLILLMFHLGDMISNPKHFLISTKDTQKHSTNHHTNHNKRHKSSRSSSINNEAEIGP